MLLEGLNSEAEEARSGPLQAAPMSGCQRGFPAADATASPADHSGTGAMAQMLMAPSSQHPR